MKKALFVVSLFVMLTACAPAQPTTGIQSTAIAIVQTGVALTQTALPTSTPQPPTATIIVYPSPSLIPTLPPPPILTPDAIQVERWKEYQTELAKALFSYVSLTDPQNRYDPEEYKDALCEWDILGQAGQEVYVWAACKATKFFGSMDMAGIEENPVVIYLEPDGSIQKVNIIRAGYKHSLPVYDFQLFPIDAQEKLCLYYFSNLVPQCFDITSTYKPAEYPPPRLGTLSLRIGYRKSHPEEPPLVILSATQMP